MTKLVVLPLVVAVLIPAGAQARPGDPATGTGNRSCKLPNGTIIPNGGTHTTSNGTVISCADGSTCRITRTGHYQGCQFEPATRAAQRR